MDKNSFSCISERPSTTHSVRTNDSRKGGKKQTLSSATKPKTVEQPKKVQGQRGQQIVHEDITPTASPTRDTTKDTTQDTYTSDETTPRSVIERERKKAPQKSASSRTKQLQSKTATGASPRQEKAVEKPPSLTPRQIQAQVQQERRLELLQHERPVIDRVPFSQMDTPFAQREAVKEYKEIAVGSGSDETILASDAETAATRGSVNR